MARTSARNKNKVVEPQRLRWTPGNHPSGAGIIVWADLPSTPARAEEWIAWKNLQAELERSLLSSVFANPEGYHFETRDFYGKGDWLVQIFDANDTPCAQVWFGVNPDLGWSDDGMLHIGNSDHEPAVWQSYRRLSNGTYERLPSKYSNLDKVPLQMKKITVGV